MSAPRKHFDLGTDDLIYATDGAVAWLTFNRPSARNAMTWAMYEGLYAACEHVDTDEAIRIFVLRGAGDRAFVAGTDISMMEMLIHGEITIHAHLLRLPGYRPSGDWSLEARLRDARAGV